MTEEQSKTKKVPLVFYSEGIRHEIGEAEVDLETGHVDATIQAGKIGSVANVASVVIKGAVEPYMSFGIYEYGDERVQMKTPAVEDWPAIDEENILRLMRPRNASSLPSNDEPDPAA